MGKEPFFFCVISNRVKQPCEPEQARGFGAMTIGKAFDLWPKYGVSWFVLIEVLHKVATGFPDIPCAHVNRRENIEQVLNVYIFQLDPLRLFEHGIVRADNG